MTAGVVRCESVPDEFPSLEAVARAEGFNFLARLKECWREGRYLDDADASLFAIYRDGALVAIGAQALDTHAPDANIRRMRQVYVHPDHRRDGVGRMLAAALIQQGLALAPLLSVNATHAASRAFWEAMGFRAVVHPSRTHELARDA